MMHTLRLTNKVGDSDAASVAKVQAVWERYFTLAEAEDIKTMHDYQLMSDLRLVGAWPEGRVVFEYHVPKSMVNLHNNLHGGAAALLLDMCTMAALGPISKPGYWEFLGGVTTALNISYLKGLTQGTTVIIDAHVVQAGKTMALLRGEVRSLDRKTVYMTADHHKINRTPPVVGEETKAKI